MSEPELFGFKLHVTARDIARPIPRSLRFPRDTLMGDVLNEKLRTLGFRADQYVWDHTVMLVEHAGRLVSSLYGWDEVPPPGDEPDDEEAAEVHEEYERRRARYDGWRGGTVGETAIEIEPTEIIGGDTPLGEILRLFTETEDRRFYFVVIASEIEHVITRMELVSLPVQMAYLSQILDLDGSIKTVLLLEAERHIRRLEEIDPNAYRHACSHGRRRGGTQRPSPEDIIRACSIRPLWSLLCDDSGTLAQAAPMVPQREAASFLDEVFRLGDNVAHAQRIPLADPHWEDPAADALSINALYGMFAIVSRLSVSLRDFAARNQGSTGGAVSA